MSVKAASLYYSVELLSFSYAWENQCLLKHIVTGEPVGGNHHQHRLKTALFFRFKFVWS